MYHYAYGLSIPFSKIKSIFFYAARIRKKRRRILTIDLSEDGCYNESIMIYITNIMDGQKIFEALSSPVRLQIVQLLHKERELNINDIAGKLNLTNSALTMHIKKLSDSGLLKVRLMPIPRGVQKLCSLTDDKLMIELIAEQDGGKFYETEFDVGQYTGYRINPTCGLADGERLLGELDSPQAFSYPDRFRARVLWFTEGYVTYNFPNPILKMQDITELQISFEISGEAPGASDKYPSDIHFFINDIDLCTYRSPGEYFDRVGRFTPNWWFKNFGQYGRFKILAVNEEGTFLDGLPAGGTRLSDLKLANNDDILFKISCEDRRECQGGVTLFGKSFGDYAQGIKCKLFYKEG